MIFKIINKNLQSKTYKRYKTHKPLKDRKRTINCWVKLQNIHHNPSKMSPVIFLIPKGYLNFSIFSQPSKHNRLKGKMSGGKKKKGYNIFINH